MAWAIAEAGMALRRYSFMSSRADSSEMVSCQLGFGDAGRDECGADRAAQFLTKSIRNGKDRILCRTINGCSGRHGICTDRGHIDDLPEALLLHYWNYSSDTVQHPRILTSIIRFHSSIFKASSGDNGMTPALLTITSTRPNVSRAN